MKKNNHFWITLLFILFVSCSMGTEQNSESNDHINTPSEALRLISESIYLFPEALTQNEIHLKNQSNDLTLSRTNASTIRLEAYEIVPKWISISEDVKASAIKFISELAKQSWPDEFQGEWNGDDLNLSFIKSTLDPNQFNLKLYVKSKEQNDIVTIEFDYQNQQNYQLTMSFKPESKISLFIELIEKETHQLNSEMKLILRHENIDRKTDPTEITILSAKRKSDQNLEIWGKSWHPEFSGDSFWLQGQKMYGFQAFYDQSNEKTVLKVGFGDPDNTIDSFLIDFSLDKVILNRSLDVLKKNLNDTLDTRFSYSLENMISLNDMISDPKHWPILIGYKSEIGVNNWNYDQFKEFLLLNSNYILKSDDIGFRDLYYYSIISQPIQFNGKSIVIPEKNDSPELNETALESFILYPGNEFFQKPIP
jgi:hypothetical protein